MPSKPGRNPLFFTFYLIGIAAVFCLMETGLRIFHYGIDTRPFIKPAEMKDYYVDNPDFLNKYYPEKQVFHTQKNLFKVKKPAGQYRGILIGESTPEGFPYESNQSFGRIAQMALINEGMNVEIINLSFTAMSSYYVADAVKKIQRYHPDFIVIYSGHNEYYGTIGALTGGGYFVKQLYLSLKEFRLFQLVLNIISPKKEPQKTGTTLMARLYQNHPIPSDENDDRKITENYIKNIESAVRQCEARHIPVFIMEPVCNLIDMPPFSGKNDAGLKDTIREYQKAFVSGDKQLIRKFYIQSTGNQEYLENANIVYLNAQSRMILDNTIDLSNYIAAKDLDTTPFRARSLLIQGLKSRFQKTATYIATSDEIIREKGPAAFGNSLFIDHLHFNFEGQCLMAKILSKKISAFFFTGTNHLETYFTNPAAVRESVKIHPLDEIDPCWKIEALLQNPPYSSMLIPYRMENYLQKFKDNPLVKENLKHDIQTLSHQERGDSLLDYFMEYYQKKNDPKGYYDLLRSFLNNAPGSFSSYFEMAQFLASVTNPPEDPLNYYYTAYLLSGKNKAVLASAKDYATRANRLDGLRQIEPNYREIN